MIIENSISSDKISKTIFLRKSHSEDFLKTKSIVKHNEFELNTLSLIIKSNMQ